MNQSPVKGQTSLISGFFQVEAVIEQAGDEASGKWTDPVNAVMCPVIRGEGRPKRARRVERGAGQRAGRQNSHCDGQPYAEARDGLEGASFVYGGGKNDED